MLYCTNKANKFDFLSWGSAVSFPTESEAAGAAPFQMPLGELTALQRTP